MMTSTRERISTDTKAKLSAAWLFVLLNVVFRDIHDLFRPGLLQEMMSGVVNGVQLTEEMMLLAGVVLEIPIAMVLLSRLLAYRVNSWANIVAGVVTIPLLLTNGPKDLDDVWFLAIDVITLLLLVWYAWKWREPALASLAAIDKDERLCGRPSTRSAATKGARDR